MKPKKFLKTLVLTFVSMLTLGLTSCGHTHSLEHVAAKDPTCTEVGNIEYWHCTDCDKYYNDAEGANEIEKSALTLAALGHNLTHVEKTDPTCTEDGNIEYWHCDRCDLNFGDSEGKTQLDSIAIKATGHNLVHTAAIAATCTEPGNKEYWYCTTCDKVYSDSEAKTEVTLESNYIPALGHNVTHHEAKAATCTEPGNIEYWSCDRCNKNFSDEACTKEVTSVIVDAKHTVTKVEAKAATCTEKGVKEHWHCSVCNKNFADEACKTELSSVEIAALGHKVTKVEAKAATCTEKGVKEHWHCSVCNKNFADEACKTELSSVEIAALGHDYEVVYDAETMTYNNVCKNDSSHKQKVSDAGVSTQYPIQVSNFDQLKKLSTLTEIKENIFVKLTDNIVVTEANIKEVPSESGHLFSLVSLKNNFDIDMNSKKISFEQFNGSVTGVPAFFKIEAAVNVTIHGNGTIDTELGDNSSYGINVNNKDAVLTVKDGTYFGAPTVFQVQKGTLNVEGGHYALAKTIEVVAPNMANYTINCIDASFKDGTAVINITGGTFKNFDPSNNPEGKGSTYVNSGCTVTEVQKEGFKEYTVAKKSAEK